MMFTLDIQISTQGVNTINQAQQLITVVKQVQGPPGSAVVWTAFRPMQMNSVEWQPSETGIFATNVQPVAGAAIRPLAQMFPAQAGAFYTFEASGTFAPGSGNAGQGYGIRNESQALTSFGLVQTVTVNGATSPSAPQNVASIFLNQQQVFTPTERLQVFLSVNQSGTVISSVPPNALTVDFGSSITSQTIHYNDSTGSFAPGPL